MTSFDDNPIIVDVNSYKKRRHKKLKIFCVLCKLPLECTNSEELRYKCPRCKNTYQLGYEILEHEDDIVSSHEDEDVELSGIESDSVGLLSTEEDDDNEFKEDGDEDDKDNKDSIPVPKYLKDSDTTKVIEYREE